MGDDWIYDGVFNLTNEVSDLLASIMSQMEDEDITEASRILAKAEKKIRNLRRELNELIPDEVDDVMEDDEAERTIHSVLDEELE